MKQGVGEQIYEGAASFGIFWALLGAVTGTIVGLISLGIGLWMLFRKQRSDTVQGKIIDITGKCENSSKSDCSLVISYEYAGKLHEKTIEYQGNTSYEKGQPVTLYLIPGDLDSLSLQKDLPRWAGGLTVGFGLLIILGGWFWYWASTKWKFVAAAEGVGGAFDIIKRF
jgi:hypothetical protein